MLGDQVTQKPLLYLPKTVCEEILPERFQDLSMVTDFLKRVFSGTPSRSHLQKFFPGKNNNNNSTTVKIFIGFGGEGLKACF